MAVELADRGEQRLAGYDVDVDAGLLVVPELVVERRLGAARLGYLVPLRPQPGDGLGILAVVVRHVSSFANDAARWLRGRRAHQCNRAPLTTISPAPGEQASRG